MILPPTLDLLPPPEQQPLLPIRNKHLNIFLIYFFQLVVNQLNFFFCLIAFFRLFRVFADELLDSPVETVELLLIKLDVVVGSLVLLIEQNLDVLFVESVALFKELYLALELGNLRFAFPYLFEFDVVLIKLPGQLVNELLDFFVAFRVEKLILHNFHFQILL